MISASLAQWKETVVEMQEKMSKSEKQAITNVERCTAMIPDSDLDSLLCGHRLQELALMCNISDEGVLGFLGIGAEPAAIPAIGIQHWFA